VGRGVLTVSRAHPDWKAPFTGMVPITTGRGLHSSTFQLNLSRFGHRQTDANLPFHKKCSCSGRKTDECKPLTTGEIAEDIAVYMQDSEQVSSAIAVGRASWFVP